MSKLMTPASVQLLVVLNNTKGALLRLANDLEGAEQVQARRIAAMLGREMKARKSTVSRARIVDTPCWMVTK